MALGVGAGDAEAAWETALRCQAAARSDRYEADPVGAGGGRGGFEAGRGTLSGNHFVAVAGLPLYAISIAIGEVRGADRPLGIRSIESDIPVARPGGGGERG